MDGNDFLHGEPFLEEPSLALNHASRNENNVRKDGLFDNAGQEETENFVEIDGAEYYPVDGGDGNEMYFIMDDNGEIQENEILGEEAVTNGEENHLDFVISPSRISFNRKNSTDSIKRELSRTPQPNLLDSDEEEHSIGLYARPQPRIFSKHKARKNRQFGSCACPECGQTFVNAARLERHLAVHQIFGSYSCPICQKSFKYEYNLFFHWRKTCRELMEVIPDHERNTMDVYNLRLAVDGVAQKKNNNGPVDIGISKAILFQTGPQSRLEIPRSLLSRRGTACSSCGVLVPAPHAPKHLALHRLDCQLLPDDESPAGGYFCDLCGIAYRQHINLIKHWRTNCPEIQANLPTGNDLVMDDDSLKKMVVNLLRRAQTKPSKPSSSFYDHEVSSMPGPSRITKIRNYTTLKDPYAESQHHNSLFMFADDIDPNDLHTNGGNNSDEIEEKWKLPECGNIVGVQCPECMRTFANVGRLERHLTGFHANFGSHHCILCGNRFKYDYNLLFHYRKSCVFTRKYMDADLRERIGANDLRKMVRAVAERRLKVKPESPEKVEETIKKAGIHPPCKKKRSLSPPKDLPAPYAVLRNPPRQLKEVRPDLSEKNPERCPICEVIFYGKVNLDRHISSRHQADPKKLRKIQEADNSTSRAAENSGTLDELLLEEPPMLERQVPASETWNGDYRFIDGNGHDIQNFDTLCFDAILAYLGSPEAGSDNNFMVVASNDDVYNVVLLDSFLDQSVKVVVLDIKLEQFVKGPGDFDVSNMNDFDIHGLGKSTDIYDGSNNIILEENEDY